MIISGGVGMIDKVCAQKNIGLLSSESPNVVSIALMVADTALHQFLDIIEENGKYAFSFPGTVFCQLITLLE